MRSQDELTLHATRSRLHYKLLSLRRKKKKKAGQQLFEIAFSDETSCRHRQKKIYHEDT